MSCIGCDNPRVRLVCAECAMHDRIRADHDDEVESTPGADDCDCYSCALSAEMRRKAGASTAFAGALRAIAMHEINKF